MKPPKIVIPIVVDIKYCNQLNKKYEYSCNIMCYT